MSLRNFIIYFTLLFTFCGPALAMAATYVIAPFGVSGPAGYSYLGQAIPSTMNTKLAWPGQFDPVSNQAAVLNGLAPGGQDAAERIRDTNHADYIVWGSVAVEGENATLSIVVQDAGGICWQHSSLSSLNNLMNDLQEFTGAISTDVFGRSQPGGALGSASSGAGATAFDSAVLNPAFRYQQTETGRTRTQMMDYEGLGVEVADLDGDGLNEILVLSPRHIYAYRMQNSLLSELGSHRLPSSLDPVLVRAVNLEGQNYVVLGGHDLEGYAGASQILSFSQNQFSVVVNRSAYYLNVAAIPPSFTPVLVGQAGAKDEIFSGAIYQMALAGNRLSRGEKITGLPREGTALNFAWLPSGGGQYAILALDDSLTVYEANRRLFKSQDMYSASIKGIMPEDDTVGYYFPIRSVVADLDHNGSHEVLVIKPVTMGGQFFSNYRNYPQGEVHALNWDGMGLNLLWKTNLIQGTLIDLCLGDADNNGSQDLLVLVNSYPGGIGIGQVRSTLVHYALDQSLTSGF